MLCVRIDGHEVETTPASLARLVFDGKADRHNPAKSSDGMAEQPLEQSLESPHCEALTGELHRRLQMICSLDSSAVDMQELCVQVERLCQWRWANLPVAARFFWTAAWLNELADRSKNAIDFYDAFLLMPSHESHLRLLALNNRGVLRIRLGRLDGVGDLARAGIADLGLPRIGPIGPISPIGLIGLPTACFNLLNLINVSFGASDLLQAADEELTDFFSRLPADLRTSWLGQPSDGERHDSPESQTDSPHGASDADSSILRDPTYKRLNSLVTRLAARAREQAVDWDPGPQSRGIAMGSPTKRDDSCLGTQSHHPADRASSVFRRLSLWDCRLNGDPPGPQDAPRHGDRFVESEYHRYAEAASLLLSDDVPSLLTRPDNPLTRVEQAAQEELAAIEGHLASGGYELAKSRLQVQRRVLASLNGHGGLTALLARVEAQIERISHLEAQEEQFGLQRTCAGFVLQVEQFCTLREVCQAQTALDDLSLRLQQFKARLSPQTGSEVLGLLDELLARSQRHVQGLKRAQVEKALGESLRHVRENRPSDSTIPVPPSVYQALAECRLHDPAGWIEDWAALEEQLNAHQGRHHIHTASWDLVQDDLTQALSWDPDLWLAVSPLFGLRADNSGSRETADVNPPFADQPLTMDRAGGLLERTLQQLGADAKKCLRLWQCVEMTLSPMLAGRDAQMLAGVRTLAETCLEHWPAGLPEVPGRADPRNPVNRFLETCEKARRLVEAQRLLDARPPQLDEAKKHLGDVLRSGLDTRDQLRRAATGLYLAQFHEKDSPPVQRQVLAGLEDWVQTMPQERVPQVRAQEIIQETEKVRVTVI
jgi:hypothetical protein